MMAQYNNLGNEVVSNIRKSQQDYYKQKISPDNNIQNIWEAVNKSLERKSKLPNDIQHDHPMIGIITCRPDYRPLFF